MEKQKENDEAKLYRIAKESFLVVGTTAEQMAKRFIDEVGIKQEEALSLAKVCIDEFIRLSYPQKLKILEEDINKIKNLPFSDYNLSLINEQVDLLCKNMIGYEQLFNYILDVEILESENWFVKGEKFFKDKNLDEALKCFDISLKFDPENNDSLIARGQVLQNLQLHKDAIKDFSQAIEENEDAFDIFYLRGCSFISIGDLNNAEKDIRKAIGLSHLANNKQKQYAEEQGYESIDAMFKTSLDLIYTFKEFHPMILNKMREKNDKSR